MRKSLFVKRVKVLAVYGRRVDGRREQDKHMQPVSECKNQKKNDLYDTDSFNGRQNHQYKRSYC